VNAPHCDGAGALAEVLAWVEKEMIIKALKETGYNVVHAARLLGITRTDLYKRMHRRGINYDVVGRVHMRNYKNRGNKAWRDLGS